MDLFQTAEKKRKRKRKKNNSHSTSLKIADRENRKPMPQTQRRRNPAEKRTRLQQAAQKLFVDQGYANTSTIQIAQAAGVSEGILFHHFGSKRGLFDAIAKDFLYASATATMPEQPATLTEESIVRAAFDFADAHQEIYRLLQEVSVEIGEDEFGGFNDIMINAIANRLAPAMQQGRIRQGNLRIMAELQYAIVDAAYRAWLTTQKSELREDYIEEAVNCMQAMLAPTPGHLNPKTTHPTPS